MTTLDAILAALAPRTQSYAFDDLPGRPTLSLRALNGDNPAVRLAHLERERTGSPPAPPTTEADIDAARAREGAEFARFCVVGLTIDGLDRTAEAESFCAVLATRAYVTRFVPLWGFAASIGQTMEAAPEEIAGE